MARSARTPTTVSVLAFAAALWSASPAASSAQASRPTGDDAAACAELEMVPNLTITFAGVRQAQGALSYRYVRGVIAPAIGFHAQLPLRANWNGRFLMWGDVGKDGDLYFADPRVAEGYAVANTMDGRTR